jgi:hypothetical protein
MGVVNHFMANFGLSHWTIMKQIFHYLKGIVDFCLCFKRNIKDVIMGKCILTNMLTIAKSRHVLKGM